MWLQIVLGMAGGGCVGVVIGAIIVRNEWLAHSTRRFLRLWQWLPVFAYWMFLSGRWIEPWGGALPRELKSVISGAGVAIPVLSIAACYQYLSFRSGKMPQSVAVTVYIVRNVFFHAFLVCLLWQLLFYPHGWNWALVLATPDGTAVALASLILLLLSVSAINLLTHSGFQQSSETRAVMLIDSLKNDSKASFFGAWVIAACTVFLWQFFQTEIWKLFGIPAPVYVFKAVSRFVVSESGVIDRYNGTTWGHIAISLIEMFFGLSLGGLIVCFVAARLTKSDGLSRLLSCLLPMTYVAPIGIWLWIIAWEFPGLIGVWHKMILVACLTFFPLLQAFWGLRDRPIPQRIALAIDDALPFAFVGMFFGELFAATAGIGFVVVIAAATSLFEDAVGACLIILTLLTGISAVLRFLSTHFHLALPADSER